MDAATDVQILFDAVCIFHSANNFFQVMHFSILPAAIEKQLSRPIFNLGMAIFSKRMAISYRWIE